MNLTLERQPGFEPGFNPGFDQGFNSGPPASFVAFFVFAVIVGIAVTVYKVSTARDIATRAGMDPDDATRMTLLSDDGFEATYLAANLRGQTTPTSPAPSPPTPSASARLRELNELLEQGLITPAEFTVRRAAIVDSL